MTLNWKLLIIGSVMAGVPLFAHHPFASEYDRSKPLTLTGTISQIQWSDPHVHIMLNVKNQSGKTKCGCWKR
jgi:Family of unknown function (DUF6152)